MELASNIWRSSLGKKYLMAATGVVLSLFVVGHMVGNLQIFLGPEAINRYGHFLQSNVELLWPVRIILLGCVVVHIWTATRLSAENRAARPVAYTVNRPVGSTYASRTMLMSGLIVLAFIIYHLLHYTVQARYVNLTGQDFTVFVDDKQRHDIFKMMVVGFSNIWVSLFYLVGVGLLSLHLSHGLSGMCQSLGLGSKTWKPLLDKAAWAAALVLFIGYAAIPVAVLLGFGKGRIQ
jgi:succinate dehydrogenase / fumarate reductase cytochrome b subunit